MAISANNTMLNMSISIKELNDKHQLNSNNNGITPIDKCMCVVNGSLGIGNILGISIIEQDYLYAITWEDKYIKISARTNLMKEDGTFGNIQDGTLHRADRLMLIDNFGKKSIAHIVDIDKLNERSFIYRIKTHRGNYILNTGVVVQSD